MDTTSLVIFIVLLIGTIVSLFFGIKFLIKYRITRKKSYLIWGIILTFVVPGVLLFFGFKAYASGGMVYGPNPMVEYGPAVDPNMVYGPGPA